MKSCGMCCFRGFQRIGVSYWGCLFGVLVSWVQFCFVGIMYREEIENSFAFVMCMTFW